MRPLALLTIVLPFGPGPSPAPVPDEWKPIDVAGLTLLIGPSKSSIGLSGYTATMPVKAAGGTGTATVRQGLTRDISVTIEECDVRELAKLFDFPAWLKPKLIGRVGKVELTTKGDRFTLTATRFRIPGDPVSRIVATGDTKAGTVEAKVYALGGLMTYTGKLPE